MRLSDAYKDDPAAAKIFRAMAPYLDTSDFNPNEEWRCVGEFRVHIDRWVVDSAKAKVVILHGGGGHGRLLAPIAKIIQSNGIEAVCPDLPGYGMTQTPHKSQLVYEDWRRVAQAVVKAEMESGAPVILFGLSMGGMLAYDVAASTPGVKGLAATCFLDPTLPNVQRAMMRWPLLQKLSLALMNHMRGSSLRVVAPMTIVGNMNGITNDAALTKAIIDDKRAGGNSMPLGFLKTFLTSPPVTPPEQFSACPVLLAHPAADRWTNVAVSKPFFDALAAPKKLVMLENAGHCPIEAPGAQQLEHAFLEFVKAI